jgi:hypothetical protein
MKLNRHTLLINFFLTVVMVSGLVSGCTSTPEKKLETKGFTLSYKNTISLGSSANKIQLSHPLKISVAEIRDHLKSMVFEELSLFGKRRNIFTSKDIDRIERLFTKALHHAPHNKIIHYELDTPAGTTSGDIFASKQFIHWRFDAIKGINFSARSSGQSNLGWGNNNWRMVPQSGQKYQTISNIMGAQALENWIFAERRPTAKTQKHIQPEKIQPHPSKSQDPSKEPSRNRPPPSQRLDPVVEEKLELLKGLYEKNLIDEKEYNQKRKELLDTYF